MNSRAPSHNTDAPVIWVLADDRAGNRAQCLGVADRLPISSVIKEIRYTAAGKWPNMLRGASLRGITPESKKQLLGQPWPDVVIAAGRRCAPVSRWIKRQSPSTKLVHLMWPDAPANAFDCIVLPSHDKDHKELPQIMRVLGAPHRISPQILEASATEWQPKLAGVASDAKIAVLVGGSSKHGKFTDADYHRLGALVKTLATANHGSVMLTTSRRTGTSGEKILHEHLNTLPMHSHNWNSPKETKNPYLGYLALADAIVVTADSIAMCSEACATHKPVFLYQPIHLSPKHQRFCNTLIATGYAYPLEEDFVSEIRQPLKSAPLDSAATIAEHIKNTWLNTP